MWFGPRIHFADFIVNPTCGYQGIFKDRSSNSIFKSIAGCVFFFFCPYSRRKMEWMMKIDVYFFRIHDFTNHSIYTSSKCEVSADNKSCEILLKAQGVSLLKEFIESSDAFM